MAPLAKNGGPQKKSWVAIAIAAIFVMGLLSAVAFGGDVGGGTSSAGSTDTTAASSSSGATDTTPTDTTPTDTTPTDTGTTSTTPADTTSASTTTDTTSTTTSGSSTTFTPTISTDKSDYNPGSTVTLSGQGWGASESVHIFVNDDKGQTWSYNSDVTADASGAFTMQFQLPATFVATYSVTATGASSGVVTASFTDGNIAFRMATVDNVAPTNIAWSVAWSTYGGGPTDDPTCSTTPTTGTTNYTNGTGTVASGNAEPSVGNKQSGKPTNASASGFAFNY